MFTKYLNGEYSAKATYFSTLIFNLILVSPFTQIFVKAATSKMQLIGMMVALLVITLCQAKAFWNAANNSTSSASGILKFFAVISVLIIGASFVRVINL